MHLILKESVENLFQMDDVFLHVAGKKQGHRFPFVSLPISNKMVGITEAQPGEDGRSLDGFKS